MMNQRELLNHAFSVVLKMLTIYRYRVTIQVVSNLLLTSKQKFCFSMRHMYRVGHLLAYLGWVDLDLECSTSMLGQ